MSTAKSKSVRDNTSTKFEGTLGRSLALQGFSVFAMMILLNRRQKSRPSPQEHGGRGRWGGNSAVFLQKIEAKPAALLVQSRTKQKSFVFLLPARRSLGAGGKEKIGSAQIKKCKENFFAGWRALSSGDGAAHFKAERAK